MHAFIFDLDGTLVDTVYAHVLAWQQSLAEFDINVDSWRIHRRVGMSGGLLLHALGDELDCTVPTDTTQQIESRHRALFANFLPTCRPLRGAIELLESLRVNKIPFGIATSGSRPAIDPLLKTLHVGSRDIVIEGKDSQHSKPEPDELVRCQKQLGAHAHECFVVGDAVWDLLAASRAGMFSVGLLTGGYAADELFQAGAHRVFADPAELMKSLYQLGIQV